MAPWTVREVDDAVIGRLVDELGIHAVTARCLAGRGLDDAGDARAFLSPRLAELRRPDGLIDLERAVARLADAVTGGERIGVFGDYDVDGVTTCAVVTSFLRGLGADCLPRLARREAGYGFTADAAEALAAAGCRVLVIGDCGTHDVAAVAAARDLGVDVIVVDHHIPGAAGDGHPAFALINPLRDESTFPFHGLAAVGLGFYLMAALRSELARRGVRGQGPDPRELLDLVALGTIADQVPLQGENRILAATGMRLLDRRERPGIAALLEVAGVAPDRTVDESTVSWKLAPRINAPGRLGDAGPALELLLCTDRQRAREYARDLDQANSDRRAEQARVLDEALALLERRPPGAAVVVGGRGWAHGVVGIVAANLAERYQRPAFVVAIDPDGEGRGSARSVAGLDLYRVMEQCREQFVRFGGHAGAGGFTVREERLDGLRDALEAAVELPQGPAPLCADAEVVLGDVDRRLATELTSLAPFGRGNQRPLLLCRGVTVAGSRRVGDGSHLKLELRSHEGAMRRAIGFGLGDRDPGVGATIDAAFAPVLSQWNGQERVELEIQELFVPG